MVSGDAERVVFRVGVDGLDPGVRASAAFVVAIVDDVAALKPCDPVADPAGAERHARALAVLRRADDVVASSSDVADAVARVALRAPWDVTIDPSLGANGPTAANHRTGIDESANVAPDAPHAGSITARQTPRRARRRWHERRVALVAPLPPEPSGVAAYSARLASALGRRCEVSCVVAGLPGLAPDPARRPTGTSLVAVDAFVADAERGRFDEIVYAIGNHPMHGTQLTLLRRFPGAVELHDVRIVGAYAGLYAPGPALDRELARLYPGRYRVGTLAPAELSMAPAIAEGVWMVREAARLATTVLTHSHHAATLVGVDSGVSTRFVGPLAVPTSPAAAAPDDGAMPVVVSAGVVDASKRCTLLIEAFGQVAPSHPDARLSFVGPVDDAYRRQLLADADRAGLAADRVEFTGHVDDAEYDRRLRHATIAVQLRRTTNGESSAAVADCLGRGIPTIVTADGAQAELPPDAVALIDPAADGQALGATIAGLLDEARRRAGLRAGALAYAAANTFDDAAERLLTALFGPDRT